jgi:ribosome maturation factor RimP
MSAAQARAVRALAEPLVAALDCDLEDVVIRQGGELRLFRFGANPDGGLPLDLVAELSRAISRALDEQDPLGQAPYVLEVSSPGVDRPLTLPRHWRRATGRLVEVHRRDGGSVLGRLVGTDDEAATLEVDGVTVRIAHATVARATVQVEFTRADEADLPDAADADAEAEADDADAPDAADADDADAEADDADAPDADEAELTDTAEADAPDAREA